MKKLSERKKKWIERTVANDRSYKVFLYNRFVVFLLSALLQLVVYIVFSFSLVYDSKWAMIAQIIVLVLEIVFVLYIISRHERPSTRLNWIILIMLVPFFGVPMYFFNGEGRPARKINAKIQRAKKENDEKIREKFGKEELPLSSERKDAVCSYLQRYAEYPVYTDGDVEYYKSGEEMFPQMLLELKKAEKFILVEYFIIAHGKMWNSILKILVEKAPKLEGRNMTMLVVPKVG